MNLKKRLLVTFLLLLILPLVLFFALIFIGRRAFGDTEGPFFLLHQEGMVQVTFLQAVLTFVLIIAPPPCSEIPVLLYRSFYYEHSYAHLSHGICIRTQGRHLCRTPSSPPWTHGREYFSPLHTLPGHEAWVWGRRNICGPPLYPFAGSHPAHFP